MIPQGYKFQSDFALKHIAEGEVRGEANAILKVLLARGLRPTAEQRTRILACTEPGRLDEWLEKVATVSDVSSLFE